MVPPLIHSTPVSCPQGTSLIDPALHWFPELGIRLGQATAILEGHGCNDHVSMNTRAHQHHMSQLFQLALHSNCRRSM